MTTRRHQTTSSTTEFKKRVQTWARRVRVRPTQVRVQPMARKWASCSRQGWVTFACDLLAEPRKFQDHVIVHELLHLKVPNHGKLFRSLLRAHFPVERKVSMERAVERRPVRGV